MSYELHCCDALRWLADRADTSVHAIVTDPPFGREFDEKHLEKYRLGSGGAWRPQDYADGANRCRVPRFTELQARDLQKMSDVFTEFGKHALRVLVPGGHLIVAANALLSHLVFLPIIQAGFEKRGEIIRLVRTKRGGDRPKNAHETFPDVTVIPRAGFEPWGLFRKQPEGTVADNLRKWQTGGLRRQAQGREFSDVIEAGITPRVEREIGQHPTQKPQLLMRQLVWAALPLGEGIVLDPFMGSGSTIAAAAAVGYRSIGLEKDALFFAQAEASIPRLMVISMEGRQCCLKV